MTSIPDLSGFRISVAMCTYNGERYLQQQLESILMQVLPVDELIVSDDGSTDSTLGIVKAFQKRAPFSVKLVENHERLGSAKNFERAIKLCEGDFIALADQDDVWFSNKTNTMVDMFAHDPTLGAIFGDAVLIDSESKPLKKTLWQTYGFSHKAQRALAEGKYERVLLKSPVVTGATLVFRSELRTQILPVPSPWMHDAWMSWMFALQSRLGFVTEPLMAYRTHASQQIGVPSGFVAMFRRANWVGLCRPSLSKRRKTVRAYRNQLAEASQLILEAMRLPVGNPHLVSELLRKKSFCESVLHALTHSRLHRFFFSIRHGRSYRRFSFIGWRAALRDVML